MHTSPVLETIESLTGGVFLWAHARTDSRAAIEGRVSTFFNCGINKKSVRFVFGLKYAGLKP